MDLPSNLCEARCRNKKADRLIGSSVRISPEKRYPKNHTYIHAYLGTCFFIYSATALDSRTTPVNNFIEASNTISDLDLSRELLRKGTTMPKTPATKVKKDELKYDHWSTNATPTAFVQD